MNTTLFHSDLTVKADGALPSMNPYQTAHQPQVRDAGKLHWERKSRTRGSGDKFMECFSLLTWLPWKKALGSVLHLRNIIQNGEMWRTEVIRDSKGEKRTERGQRMNGGKDHCKKHPFFLEPGITLLCGHCGRSTHLPKLPLIYF